jgi:beta-lactam-binding protein with PASTA domain
MSLKDFLTSKVFLKHFLASIGLTLGVVIFALLILRFYTRHGEAYPVPNVYGLSEDEFSRVLDKADLKYKVVDSTYNNQIKAGGVVDQVPEAGHKVKRNRVIYLTLNASGPEIVNLPRLTDISYRQAVVQLETAGLLPGKISYEPSEYQNLVLEARLEGKEIKEGDIVTKGTMIDLVLGSGTSGGSATLPDLRGLSLAEGRAALSNATLNLGTLFYDETVITGSDSLTAIITRQHPSPEFSYQTAVGSNVDIWLSTDPGKIERKKANPQEESFF